MKARLVIYILSMFATVVLELFNLTFLMIILGIILSVHIYCNYDCTSYMYSEHEIIPIGYIILSIIASIFFYVYFERFWICMNGLLSIGLIIQLKFEMFYEKKEDEEIKRKIIKYIESRNINENLSKNIRNYLKTGTVFEGYYNYHNYSFCSKRINGEICELVKYLKKALLYCVTRSDLCKDYYTSKGLIREVKIGGFFVYSLYDRYKPEQIEWGKSSYDIIEHYNKNDLENWRRIVKEHGFDYTIHMEDDTPTNHFQNIIMYAYIKIEEKIK